jgi:hypothetical protein
MKGKNLARVLAVLLVTGAGSALACEYVPGETEFMDYANCLYPADALKVVDLPAGGTWQKCVYLLEAFRPPKLLAVTRVKNGKEEHSINSRGNIGNPCYLTKRACDAALKAQQ